MQQILLRHRCVEWHWEEGHLVERGNGRCHRESIEEHLLVGLSEVETILHLLLRRQAFEFQILDFLWNTCYEVLALLDELVIGWLVCMGLVISDLLRNLHLRESLHWELRRKHRRLSHLHHLISLIGWFVDLTMHETVTWSHDRMVSISTVPISATIQILAIVHLSLLLLLGMHFLSLSLMILSSDRGWFGNRQVWILCLSYHISELIKGLNECNHWWSQILIF